MGQPGEVVGDHSVNFKLRRFRKVIFQEQHRLFGDIDWIIVHLEVEIEKAIDQEFALVTVPCAQFNDVDRVSAHECRKSGGKLFQNRKLGRSDVVVRRTGDFLEEFASIIVIKEFRGNGFGCGGKSGED